jgi:hypothetical protein
MHMKKILSAFAIASLFCVAGCPKKTEEPKKDDTAAKPTDDKTATPTPTPEPTPTTAPTPDKPATDKAATPSGDLPAECNDYKDAMTKAATCDKLGKQRDTFKKQFDESWAAWEKLDAAGKAALAQGCKTTAQAVKDATAKACP